VTAVAFPTWMEGAIDEALERALERKERQQQIADWPAEHLIGPEGVPVPFHRGQRIAWESERRIVAMIAGTQGGKTGYGSWWMEREAGRCGGGDHLAVTASYDLFKLKMLPAMLEVFEHTLGIGRYWAGDRIIELSDPDTGQFLARKSTDPMWGRIILRSADALGGLESATARSAWLDEAGQDRFSIDAWRAIRRRLALYRGRILITTTLYNLGWVAAQIIDKATHGGVVSLEHIGAGELEHTENDEADITLVQFDSIINPTYPLAEYEEAQSSMPDDEFQMFYRGRKATLRNLIYDALDRIRHVVPRFPIPDQWPRYLGLDFGGANTAGMFYAEEPKTGRLYCYREYLSGKRSAAEHAEALLRGEPGVPLCVGGAKSEGQWRLEFANGGLPVLPPTIADVNLGINRVYAQHKKDAILYFDDLEGVLDEKGRYKRKRDKLGEPTDEIENKNSFHRLDAERYIIGYIRPGEIDRDGSAVAEAVAELTARSRWTDMSTPRWTRSGLRR
jgi:hypothetical protein